MSVKRIGVLISGGGTNLQAIIDGVNNRDINGEVAIVVSNRKDAYGLKRAELNGIRNEFIDYNNMDTDSYNKRLLNLLLEERVDLVVLAGYLKVVGQEIISTYRNRIINIHPSLIPSFCGKGYYGEKVHQAVLDKGVKITGVTVHYVDEGTDTGKIIMQKAVEVMDDDTISSLQKRVLVEEHKLLVEALKILCN